MSEEDLETALREQKRRVLAALKAAETLDATPLVRDGEILSGTEYVTLVYELHHVHLPKLVTEGLVEFDAREGEVRQGQRFGEGISGIDP